MPEENVAKVAKTFLVILKKKWRKLNVTKIRKSKFRGNLKSQIAGTDENLTEIIWRIATLRNK